MKCFLSLLPLVLASCSTTGYYAPLTQDRAYIYQTNPNPFKTVWGGELYTNVASVDGKPVASRKYAEVDTGKRTVSVKSYSTGGAPLAAGTMSFTVEKDKYYYVSCRRVNGVLTFACEVDEDEGMRTVATAPVSRLEKTVYQPPPYQPPLN